MHAEIAKGSLSLAERGRTSISVPTLLRVSLCSNTRTLDVVRSGLGAPLEMGGVGIQEYLLTPSAEQHVQVMRTVLDPGGSSGGARAGHPGSRTYTLASETVFVVVIRGRLELAGDGRELLLEVGDCHTFSARSPHAWRNPSGSESEVLWSIAPPIPQDARHPTR